MATTICNPLVINLDSFNSGTLAPARTYTATRQLRMYDLKSFQVADATLAVAITVSNGAALCITLSMSNPAHLSLTRLGQASTANLLDETNEVVAAGGTIVFASDDAANTQAFLYCWTL